MTAGGHKKFLFDTDFGFELEAVAQAKSARDVAMETPIDMADDLIAAAPEPVEETPPPPTYSEEDLARAREEGRLEGRDEATRDLAGAMEQRVAQALEAVDARIAHLLESYGVDMEQHSMDAIAIATVMVRKLFPALNMDKAMAQMEAMIVEAMQRTSGAPSLIVRVPADIHAEVEERVAAIAKMRGREGTLTVLADETMSPGDISVEWAGGGMLRDTAFIWQELDEIIERNLGRSIVSAHPDMSVDAPRATAKQEVENPAPVGENIENPTESSALDAGGPED